MSFAADMKDFTSAAQAGQKMVGAKDDLEYKRALTANQRAQTAKLENENNDEETRTATLGNLKAKTRNLEGATALQGLRGQLTKAQIKQLTEAQAPEAVPTSSSIVPATRAIEDAPAAPAQAVPAAPPQASGIPAPAAQEPLSPDLTPPTAQYSAGGSVQKFAGGGAVGEPEPDEGDPAESGEDEGASSPTDISARGRGAPSFSHAAASDAVHAGLTYGAKALGLHSAAGVMTPGRQRAANAWSGGAHAASPQEMDAVKKSIDPDNQLPESSRNLAAVGAMYQFKMAKGDTEGAARAAFQMIQHYRQASQRYAVIAAHAAQNGDIDTATYAAMKAYANVPNGQNFQLQRTSDGKISYTVTDEKTGKVKAQGIETPEKLASSAMGFAQNGFDESLMAAVQQRPAASAKPAVDPNAQPMKTPDKTAALKGIDAAYTDQNPDDEKTSKPKYSPGDARDLKGAAFRISAHTANSRLTPGEAMDVTTKIADPTSLDQAGFATKKTDGGYQVRIGKKEVFVPEADFETLLEKRNAKLKSLAPKAGDNEPGIISKAVTAGGKYLSGLRDRNKAALASKDFNEPSIP